MRTLLAVMAALALAAIPPWIDDAAAVVALAVPAGAILLWSAVRPSLAAAAAGGALALAAYALALWSSQASPGLLDALAVGVALVLVVETTDFARTFRGAEVAPAIVAAVHRGWAAAAVLGAIGVILLAGAVSLADLGAPPVFRPLLAGAGALLALAAVLAALGIGGKGR
ncbi:MAG: hypothetical protein EXQ95_15110 [Alphaproteobacteria bacterium]|nr:hypothetical protein [Alphaproteobacteria bacterium]